MIAGLLGLGIEPARIMIVGDSAGYLNGARLKGIHLGIKAGMLAAETAFHALLSGDTSSAQLQEYEAMFENSWARDELWLQRNFDLRVRRLDLPQNFPRPILRSIIYAQQFNLQPHRKYPLDHRPQSRALVINRHDN